MEAAEETLTYRDDTGLHRKLLPEDKAKDNTESEVHAAETNYVDLDMKPDGAKTVKVSFTSNGNQLSVIKCQREHERESGSTLDAPPLETPTKRPHTDPRAETEQPDAWGGSDELQYTEMSLNSKAESEDGVSAVLSDHCGSDTVEDESHYITTHEIQLTELDHDVDYDLGRGTCWDFEDDNLVYSFVDYASFESDDMREGALVVEGRSQAKGQSNLAGTVVPTEQDDSDLCDSDKCASSDESVCKTQSEGTFHLSIQTSARAVDQPLQTPDTSPGGYTEHFGDRSHFSFVTSGARAGPLCDGAQYFIPAPGRQHLATKLRRKDINEYSSGASSSISELDDADKEVRNLTARSFRSLACPYFDAINLSTSSESSLSEYGLNKWSAYVDWNYGRERSVIAHKTSSATLGIKTVSNKRHGKSSPGTKAPQTKECEASRRTNSPQASTFCKKVEVKDPAHSKQRGVTLNLRCNVEEPEGTRRAKCSESACNEVTGTVLSRSGCEVQYHHADSAGDSHNRAIFASSLLKNVISKKMQFEQERKMERGELRDAYPPLSSCLQFKNPDGMKERSLGRGFQRQTSDSGSGFIANAADDPQPEGSRASSCEPTEQLKNNRTPDRSKRGGHDPPTAPLCHSQSRALKEDDAEPVKEAAPTAVSGPPTTAMEDVDTSSILTKLLFVPSCQLLSKRKDFTHDLTSSTHVRGTSAGPQKCEKEFRTGNNGNIVGHEKKGKTPEIKICLRNVNESKGCTLNIANLLTPKITYNSVNTFRSADAKCHILSATEKVPNFTVRDMRDTRCKFQTPIYHVRDVRKLVKSSYRFVSLDSSESKCSTVIDKPDEKPLKEAVRHLLPSPIVIKCHSVKTNGKSETSEAPHKQAEAGTPPETAHSENTPSPCTAGRVPPNVSKQKHPDHTEVQQNTDTKPTKRRQDKFTGETAESRNEPTLPKQAAIEKLKAAVKTMEQLYDFDKNEWKRKTHALRPVAESHVLSLIAREKQGVEELEATNTDRSPQPFTSTAESGKTRDSRGAQNIIHVPYNDETIKTQSQQSTTFSNNSVLHFGDSNKAHVSISSVSGPISQSSMKSSKTLVAPLLVKIEPPTHSQVERGKVTNSPTRPAVSQGCSDYLTIPGLGYTNEIKLLNQEPDLKDNTATPEQKSPPLIMEHPVASIYHHPVAGPQTQPQVWRFSPSVPTLSPTPSTGETAPQTQRKMLLDPTTGHYYLVDTPIQAKRLFDPETGQYVDVPMPQSPVAPVTPVTAVTPVTPVPLSLSPLALSRGAYAPTYMIYPSFIPSPTLPAQAVLPQPLCHSEDGEKGKSNRNSRQESNMTGAESAYYSPTGAAPQAPLQPRVTTRGGAASSERKPVISITTQQGPRIIAPPSFDGTTMSFVVEHR